MIWRSSALGRWSVGNKGVYTSGFASGNMTPRDVI